MSTEEVTAPEPEEPEEPDEGEATAADPLTEARDAAYQSGYEDACSERRWIASCLTVLQADIDTTGYDPMSLDALRELRVEACRRAARVLRSDVESPLEGE